MTIHFLQNKDIDKPRWDSTIRNSANGLIYAWSIYLDSVCPGWSALVNDDYSLVMPLTNKKKYGISYLYQPPFCQQLGVFGTAKITENIVDAFITECTKHFSFGEIFLNSKNVFSIPSGLASCKNYTLELNKEYALLRRQYTASLVKKSLERIEKFNLQYSATNNVAEAVNLSRQLYAERIPHVTDTDYSSFLALANQLYIDGHALVREVSMPGTGELLASGLFLKDEKRIYNIISATVPNGRTYEANHFLFDKLIEEFAGTGLVLDFEGSDIAGIEHFYKKFGATDEGYYFLKWNELPWPARLLKK